MQHFISGTEQLQVRVRLFSDIGHVMTKIDWEGTDENLNVCWGLKI